MRRAKAEAKRLKEEAKVLMEEAKEAKVRKDNVTASLLRYDKWWLLASYAL